MVRFQRIRGWWKNGPRGLKLTFMIILGVLILSRLALPSVLKIFVNHKLSQLHGYGGKVGDITVHLWRGAYSINNIDIYKTSGDIHEPLFEAVTVDLSIAWLQLFHGVVVGNVYMMKPKVNFVAGPTEEQSQTGAGGEWDQLLTSLFPFDLNRLESRDGAVYFHNDYSKPKVDIFMDRLNLVATNLTNAEKQKGELPARIQATGRTSGDGAVNVQVKLNPVAKQPAFELTGTVNGMDLTAVNSFIQAYGGFEIDKGRFSLYATVASKDGSYDGYLKIFFEKLHVFVWEKEKKKDILRIFWDAIMGGVAAVLTNPNGNLATKVPISGSYGKNQVGVWSAIGSVIQNAFFRALLPKFDEKITVKTVEKKTKEMNAKKEEEKAAPISLHPLPARSR
jgi:hypothetical protein